jgi:hypothetical protein
MFQFQDSQDTHLLLLVYFFRSLELDSHFLMLAYMKYVECRDLRQCN